MHDLMAEKPELPPTRIAVTPGDANQLMPSPPSMAFFFGVRTGLRASVTTAKEQ
jgi:hypothetical protein